LTLLRDAGCPENVAYGAGRSSVDELPRGEAVFVAYVEEVAQGAHPRRFDNGGERGRRRRGEGQRQERRVGDGDGHVNGGSGIADERGCGGGYLARDGDGAFPHPVPGGVSSLGVG
jgi:hypothetical protein